jgi:predicted lipoprotein with Yx(FWY)xxD motif
VDRSGGSKRWSCRVRGWFAVCMRTLVLLALTCIAAAGCGGEAERPGSQPPGSGTTVAPSASPRSPDGETASGSPGPNGRGSGSRPVRRGREVKVARSEYGRMLFDTTGQAIYLFDKERNGVPECYGACAQAWPPVLTKGRPHGVGAVRARLLGTTERRDGSLQVTYQGHPLYYYAHEGKNEVLCHNVTEFGGLWLVVTPSGEPAP